MNTVSSSERLARQLVGCCAVVASGTALFALLIRLAGHWWPWTTSLKTWLIISPRNALLLALLGAALFAFNRWPQRSGSRILVGLVVSVVGLTCLLALAGNWIPIQNGYETWFAALLLPGIGRPAAIMSLHTAATFLCVAASFACLLASPAISRWQRQIAFTLALATFGSSSFVVIGSAIGTPMRYEYNFSRMMWFTAVIFVVLAVGLMLAAFPKNWLLQGLTGETSDAADEQSVAYRRVLAMILVFLTGGIGVAGFHFLRKEQANLRVRVEQELAAIADLKAAQIADWRRERMKEANLVFHTPYAARRALNVLANPASEVTRGMFTGWLDPFLATGPYAEALVLDSDLKVGLVYPPARVEKLFEGEREAAQQAFRSRQVIMTDLHQSAADSDAIYLSVMVPIIVRKEGGRENVPAAGLPPSPTDRAAGMVVLRMDARQTLFPLVKTWPTASQTAETLLVRRDGNECVFLNELRHLANSAFQVRVSMERTNMPAVQAVLGTKRPIRGVDYRAASVLAVTRQVPNSAWFLVAKMDEEEIYAPVYKRGWVLALIVTALMLGVAMGLNLLWRRRDVEFLRRQVAGERERLALAQRLAHVMTHANDIIVMTDDQWRILEANDRALEAYGYTSSELKRMRAAELRTPEALVDFPAFAEKLRTQGQVVAETYHRCKDGTVFPVEVSARKVEIDGNIHNLAIIRDITERHRVEESIRQSEEKYRVLFDGASEGIAVADVETLAILYANPAFSAMYGYMNGEVLRLRVKDMHPRESLSQAIAEFRALASGERSRAVTFPCLRKDGSVFFAEISAKQAVIAGRAVLVGFFTDITERRRSEESLRKQAALLDAANDVIYVRALDHTVTYWNEGAARLYGWTRSEVLGRRITELGVEDPVGFERAHVALLIQGSWSGELKKTSKTGEQLTMFCRWTLLTDEQGRPKEVLAISSDITDKKHLEAQFLRAQRLEGVGALAGGIAHDLNNILAPIMMSTSLLRETVNDPESRNMLTTMSICAQRGADIIKQLLTFARGKPSARVPMPVRHLLQEMVKIIRETFPRNIQPVFHAPKDLWPVMGDPTQIHQALMNLCVNARDAMPDGGTLTVAAANLTLDEASAALIPDAQPVDYVCVSVTDTGTGISPENLDHIFDPFFTTKDLGKGTGLGLPTVLGIIRGHDGFVRVTSRMGHGTTLEMFLRASPEADVPKVQDIEGQSPRGNGELILVVDDETGVRRVVQNTLEKYGYRVETATEGNEALTLFHLHRDKIQVVLTDMMMPGMEGPALVRALRQLEPQLPIIGMTGLAERVGVKGIESLRLPVVLIKPFAGTKLLAAIHEAVAGRAEVGAACMAARE